MVLKMVIAAQHEQKKVQHSWEEYISMGLEAREAEDNSSWLLGDLALGIEKDYGQDSVGKYSYAIGVARKTLMNYRTVSNRFPRETRSKYRKLSFSHFKVLTSLEKPEAWLEKADDNDWSVETLTKEVHEAYGDMKDKMDDTPPRVIRCKTCGLWRLEGMSMYDVCKGHYEIEDGQLVFK